MTAPLAGVQIVDLSRILAGPFATQLLADLGATVLKVEPPGGDPTRAWGPPFEPGGADGEAGGRGESAYFRCANRGKRSIALDLRADEDRRRLFDELEQADVLVENFLPRSARELGLTREALGARFPRLIVASVRSFASDTDASERAGYDFLLQAESGWMSVTGESDGAPMKVGFALVDVLAALYLANGIQAALRRRDRDGVASHVEVPLMEAALSGLVNVGASALMTEEVATRYGNAHPNIVPYQSFSCSDGEVAIAVGNDAQFRALCDQLGLGDRLDAEPGWRTNPGRVEDRARVVEALASPIAGLTVDSLLERCRSAGVAAGPVRGVTEALLVEAGRLHRAVIELESDDGRKVPGVASPILLDGVRAASDRPPPRPPR